MHLYEKISNRESRDLWIAAAIFIVIIALFLLGFFSISSRSSGQEAALVEDALRHAAVTCYAAEGRYPESLAYLTENYGVTVDKLRYRVVYEVYASNVMPEIRVIERGGGQ